MCQTKCSSASLSTYSRSSIKESDMAALVKYHVMTSSCRLSPSGNGVARCADDPGAD